MSEELKEKGLKGEWKLLKIWECSKCKALIREERRVYDHRCAIEENELTLCNKTIEEQKSIITNQNKIIEDQNKTIEEQKIVIQDKDLKIEKQNETIKVHKETIENQKKMIIGQNKSIEYHKKTIEGQKIIIDEQTKFINEKAEEDQNKMIEDQKRTIEGHKRAIESQKKSIDQRDIIINDQKRTIEIQTKIIRDQDINEKTVSPTIPKIHNENNGAICVYVLEKGNSIKDSKDIGYREDTEIEISEKGKGKDRIIIKNGKLVKKPEHIDIVGENTSDGFLMKGILKTAI